MGDTQLQVCVNTTTQCTIELRGFPSELVFHSEIVGKNSVISILNPPVNLEKAVQVFADCGDGQKLVASARRPEALTGGMCIIVNL